MALLNTLKNRTAVKNVNREQATHTGGYVYYDTIPEEPELTEDDRSDSPVESDEESDDEDYSSDTGIGVEMRSVIPVWVLYDGQIMWAAQRYGFSVSKKEYLRRRFQILLDFLRERFPEKSYGDLLKGLHGFFARDNKDSQSGWLSSLDKSGLVYFDDSSGKYELMPLDRLRAGKGQGRGRGLPKNLERLWFEHERTENGVNFPDEETLSDSIRNFCADLNELCSTFEGGIGLKRIDFGYEASTLQRKLSSLIGMKPEFSHFSGVVRACSELHEAGLIIGDPSHPNFQLRHTDEDTRAMRPVPALIILPNDVWGDSVNSVLKNPLYDVRGIFRGSKLFAESPEADEYSNFCEAMKVILRQILRGCGLTEEDFSKPVDWKVKVDEGVGVEFMSLFSAPAMQKMSAKYKDALLEIDDPFLKDLREKLSGTKKLKERCRELGRFFDGRKNSYRIPSLLILGETGCGKSLLAGTAASVIMPNRKMERVNISAYDSDSVDIMLFGAEEGSYTSSNRDRIGLFIGHCGEVVFLDEIGDMPPETQTRLLTYMDNAQVLPRGMEDAVCAPCILIAATNRDVRNDPSFRKDVFNRFTHVIEIPSLRERMQDIRLLVSMILQDEKINPVAGEGRKAERISLDAVSYLEGCEYAGNFRELKFCVAQGVNAAFSEGSRCLCLRHLVRT